MSRLAYPAEQRWCTHLPGGYAELLDLAATFADLEREAEAQIAPADHLVGDVPGEGFMEKLERLGAARLQTEEIVLRDLVLPEPEPEWAVC